MCNLTILSILQNPNTYIVQPYISLRGNGVKQCTSAIRVCSFTAWFSWLKCIKNDRKIQDMGAENLYFTFHIVKNHTKGAIFFFKNKHDYKCDIDFISTVHKQ